VADPASSSAEKAARPSVLVLANDASPGAAKTSRHLALALNRLGFRAVVRDTRLIRWGAQAAGLAAPARREAFEIAAVAKWAKLIEDYGIGLVLSLDLHWLVSKNLFVNDANVRQVHSFWVGDVPAATHGAFALDARELIGAAKVTHHCSRPEQAEALRRLGVERVRPFAPAAPAEYLRADAPCEVRDRLGFVGDPARVPAALVGRLAQRGWLDVYGPPEAWQRHGVAARPVPPFAHEPSLWRRYPAVLSLEAGESIAEIAACGRLALTPDRPGLRDGYGEDELVVASGEEAMEAAAEKILRDPEAALAAGEKARLRTARDHLWENRLEAALA